MNVTYVATEDCKMKKFISYSFLVLALLLSSCAGKEQSCYTQAKPIIILSTNDVHAGIDDHIGYAGLKAYKNEMEAKYGEAHVLLVDSGDFVQGASVAMLTQGKSVVTLMNQVDYDYVTLGNHEFDYQIPRMFELSKELEAEIVSANFSNVKDNKPVFAPYEMYSVDGVDIAFIGITTPEALTKASSEYFQDDNGEFIYAFAQDVTGEALYAVVQESVDNARRDGAEYVVALTHLGVDEVSKPWRSTDIIANVEGIDVVLDGHSHSVIEGEVHKDKAGNDVVLMQTGRKLQYIGKVVINPDSQNDISAELIDESEITYPKDANVQAKIDEVQAEFAELLSQNVSYSDFDLVAGTETEETARMQETNLGDLVADAYRKLLKTDVAIVNGGALRSNLSKGHITYGEIIDLHPFGNYIISMEVSGKAIKDALEMGAKNAPTANGGFLQVSGMMYEIDTSIPSSVEVDLYGNFVAVNGDYRVKNIKIHGHTLDENKVYSLASHDYLLKRGGDGLSMFKDATIVKDMFMLDNELLIKYITESLNGKVGSEYANPQGSGRITIF